MVGCLHFRIQQISILEYCNVNIKMVMVMLFVHSTMLSRISSSMYWSIYQSYFYLDVVFWYISQLLKTPILWFESIFYPSSGSNVDERVSNLFLALNDLPPLRPGTRTLKTLAEFTTNTGDGITSKGCLLLLFRLTIWTFRNIVDWTFGDTKLGSHIRNIHKVWLI